MSMNLQYGNEVVVLPAAALDVMARATVVDLRVLLTLCANRDVRADLSRLSACAGCTVAQVEASVAFWRGAGVITVDDKETDASVVPCAEVKPAESETVAESATERVQVVGRSDSLPRYTTEELSSLLESRKETAALIDECQRILGKIFNVREIGILVAMLDYLSLDAEYLILLCAHCAKLGKTSLHYVEKVALDMVDGGANTVEALQETLRREDAARESEGQIRALFGARDRKLTAAERKYIHRWLEEWRFDMPMIELAYEATVDSIGEASMRYTDGVLKRWYAEGLNDPAAVAVSDDKWRRAKENGTGKTKAAKEGKEQPSGSFDTDDFFEAALRRSFEDL